MRKDHHLAPNRQFMIVSALRLLAHAKTVFVGVGLPGEIAYSAKQIEDQKKTALIFESGCIDASPSVPPRSVADPEVVSTSLTVTPVAEIFNYWVAPGWIDVAIVGAAQIDRQGNINSTVIGEYSTPQVRLPGAGGAPTIANFSKETIVVATHDHRTMVEEVDFVTTPGAFHKSRQEAPHKMTPAAIITDCGILRPNQELGEYELTEIYPEFQVNEVKAKTGWELKVSDQLRTTSRLSDDESEALEKLATALAERDRSIRT